MQRKNLLKFSVKIAGFVLSLGTLIFTISEHYGLWDSIRGLTLLEDAASKLETSYAEMQRQFRPADPEWEPLIDLIYKYSPANFPKDKEPKVIARSVAVSSAKLDLGNDRISEWTAPSTSILVLYKEWPGSEVAPDDYRVVGTIGDLRNWIIQGKSEFKFNIENIFLGILSLVVLGFSIAL